jgi:Na+/phosphate symporter
MNDLKVRRWAGAFGVAGFVLFLVALPLYFVGPQPMVRLEDTVQFSDSVTRASTFILTRATLADPLIMACLLVFLAGFRHLIRQARSDYEWVGTLVFGSGLVVITLELAGDALQGGAALDTFVKADPTVVRGLMEGSFVFYGAIGLVMSALLLASAGYAILATGVLPRWIGWVAYACAIVNLVAAPSIFGGTDYTGFYTASGYVTFIAQGAMVIWFLIASVSMIVVKREAVAPTPAYGG